MMMFANSSIGFFIHGVIENYWGEKRRKINQKVDDENCSPFYELFTLCLVEKWGEQTLAKAMESRKVSDANCCLFFELFNICLVEKKKEGRGVQ
jgi:hypothetical protein